MFFKLQKCFTIFKKLFLTETEMQILTETQIPWHLTLRLTSLFLFVPDHSDAGAHEHSYAHMRIRCRILVSEFMRSYLPSRGMKRIPFSHALLSVNPNASKFLFSKLSSEMHFLRSFYEFAWAF